MEISFIIDVIGHSTPLLTFGKNERLYLNSLLIKKKKKEKAAEQNTPPHIFKLRSTRDLQ